VGLNNKQLKLSYHKNEGFKMFQQRKIVSAIICSTLALTACNSNDDDN